jgi:hypothetical protein
MIRIVRIVRIAAACGVSVLVGSCCQTLWFDVTRRASAPVPAVVLPAIADGAIPIPVGMENRILDRDQATWRAAVAALPAAARDAKLALG